MENNKPRGGSSCAVATCTNYSGKIKSSGRKETVLIIVLYFILK